MKEFEPFSTEFLNFVDTNLEKKVSDLILKNNFGKLDKSLIINQIVGKKIAKSKFPFLLKFDQYRFPTKISLEQSSSENTARFKSKLMEGHSLIDLTGGMGIDTFYLSKKFNHVVYLESNEKLFHTTMQNFKTLQASNISGINIDCTEVLKESREKFDWVYIDPSRRLKGQKKTSIHNYEPNVIELRSELLSLGNHILMKLSPMQDISECVNVLQYINEIWVISVNNEVKELLVSLNQEKNDNPIINVVDLSEEGIHFSYALDYNSRLVLPEYSEALDYIYQPLAGVVKTELQNAQAYKYNLKKLDANTQLFTSNKKISDFPGRVFRILKSTGVNAKSISSLIPSKKANIISKNFPLTPNQLKKKLKLNDGGDAYIIACTDIAGKKLLFCERLN